MKKIWNIYTERFGTTILHPQFIINRYKEESINTLLLFLQKKKGSTVLDIGCGRMPYRNRIIESGGKYVGVDHPKISKLYPTNEKPDLLEDVEKGLSLKSSSVEFVALFEVLEYLDYPEKTFAEVHRLLKKDGLLIFTAPFMYPVHDYPYDKNRLTDVRLKKMLEQQGFKTVKVVNNGNIFQMVVLSILVALFKNTQKIIAKKDLALQILGTLLLGLSFLLVIPLNVAAYVASKIDGGGRSDFVIDTLIVAKKY